MGQSGPGGQHQGGLTRATPTEYSVSPIGKSQRPDVRFGSMLSKKASISMSLDALLMIADSGVWRH
jgi:hypothetical protein